MLLEESNDVRTFFFAAILRHFTHIMTDKNASYVAIQGLRVFSKKKKRAMYKHIIRHAITLARDQYGNLALGIIITNLGHSFYRDKLLHIVALNALALSCDANGTFVVQHVLKLQDLDNSLYRDQLLHIVALNALALSCDAHGNFVVQHALELNDSGHSFYRDQILHIVALNALTLSCDAHGNFVVQHALELNDLGHSFYRDQILYIVALNALTLSCDAHGTFVVQHVLKLHDLDHSFYRNQLLYIVALNALMLSYNAHGHLVVRHAIELNDWRCTHNVAVNLNGRCVELSFNKYGSHIVEKLLETERWVMVVTELLVCDVAMLRCLARSEYGNFVVLKALSVTQGEVETSAALFWGLVNKLMPINLLEDSHGRRVARFLEVIQYFVAN